MKTIREKIEVMEAFERGGKLEVRANYGTREGWENPHNDPPYFDWYSWDYRIKPAKKMRLILAEELPPVFWVKRSNYQDWSLVNHFLTDGSFYCTLSGRFTIKGCADDGFTFSEDRKTVRSFMVEEGE